MEEELNPDVQAELDRIRETLDRRYDELKSGSVKLIDGEEAFDRLRQKSKKLRQSLSD